MVNKYKVHLQEDLTNGRKFSLDGWHVIAVLQTWEAAGGLNAELLLEADHE